MLIHCVSDGVHLILPGCACSDDAAPDNEYTEYCEVLFTIDLQTADSTVSLLSDE